MKFIIGFSDLNGYAAGGRIYISLRRDKRLLHGVRRMQTPKLKRCRSSSQKIFARQIFFGSPVFILVRTAMRLCSHSHISLRYVVAANFAFHASVLTHIRKLCFVASPLPTKILRLFVGALPYPVRPCRGLFLWSVYEWFPFSFRANVSHFSGTRLSCGEFLSFFGLPPFAPFCIRCLLSSCLRLQMLKYLKASPSDFVGALFSNIYAPIILTNAPPSS